MKIGEYSGQKVQDVKKMVQKQMIDKVRICQDLSVAAISKMGKKDLHTVAEKLSVNCLMWMCRLIWALAVCVCPETHSCMARPIGCMQSGAHAGSAHPYSLHL